jgi:hypothetical protein
VSAESIKPTPTVNGAGSDLDDAMYSLGDDGFNPLFSPDAFSTAFLEPQEGDSDLEFGFDSFFSIDPLVSFNQADSTTPSATAYMQPSFGAPIEGSDGQSSVVASS